MAIAATQIAQRLAVSSAVSLLSSASWILLSSSVEWADFFCLPHCVMQMANLSCVLRVVYKLKGMLNQFVILINRMWQVKAHFCDLEDLTTLHLHFSEHCGGDLLVSSVMLQWLLLMPCIFYFSLIACILCIWSRSNSFSPAIIYFLIFLRVFSFSASFQFLFCFPVSASVTFLTCRILTFMPLVITELFNHPSYYLQRDLSNIKICLS